MKDPNQEPTVFHIQFEVNLPKYCADFSYSICSNQVTNGSIIHSHFPLDHDDQDKLHSVFNIISLKNMGGIV